ncbi:MAG TPA: family 78 glycoside hydrolase catalytic domain [Clostridiales bacterium]|nr:family 78 glycoside hydrolase catalytic domain [Clostridiales bacterium]
MKIIQMKTNHVINPLGYMMTEPVLSYKVACAEGKKQTSARIQVALDQEMKELVYDSGDTKEIDSISYRVPMELKPCTRYYWTVTVNTDAGETMQSGTAWFETGKMQEGWSGKWISSDLNVGTHPFFFKDFKLRGKVKKARLYICGLGLYEAYINGKKISEECLTPYYNNYDTWLQYQTYDVTELLAGEKIHLEVLLGNGWYKGRFGLNNPTNADRGLYGDTFTLISELKIEYMDGSTELVLSDESWKAKKSKLLASTIYDGEVYDETFREDMEYPVRLYEKKMARLCERLSLPIKVQESIKPIKLITSPKGEAILDLGQNHSGWFSLRVKEPKGTQVKLYFGEELQDGCFYNTNLRTAKAEYTYISDGTEQTIRPHFTFYGYRYVMLEGFTNFSPEDYTALVLYSDLEDAGHFETDNPLVNRLILNAKWGQKSNFLDVPTDCPQRDERLGWTGDAQVFAATACFNMDSYAFYKKYLYDMYEEQKIRDGAVPDVIPACGQQGTSTVWGDAATIIPWVVYQFYGDKTILEEQYDSMKAWVEYIRKTNGGDWQWRKKFHYGDWLALDSKDPDSPIGATDTGYIATVYYYYSTLLVSKAAGILGRTEDERNYGERARELLAEIHKEYFSPTGRPCVTTQTGLITALKFDVAVDRQRILDDLVMAFKLNGNKLETGFVGTPLLCNVLSENGLNEIAYSLLVNEDYPGWLYAVKLGATTIWERWNSLDPEGHFSSTGMNSLNHYSYGSIVEWMYRHVAGINPVLSKPGFREVELAPKPDHRLKRAEVSFDSPIGVYKSKWEITPDFGLSLDITVPFGGKAYLTLPYAPEELYQQKDNEIFKEIEKTEAGRRCILESGTYHIEYATTAPMRKIYTLKLSIGELMASDKAKAVLMEVNPMFTRIPKDMQKASLYDLLKYMPVPLTKEVLAQIDGKLQAII